MHTTPLVSAIIATYNRAYIVEEAIESILSQTYGNLELIVVDDGSTDDTRHRLQKYAGRIRVISQQNRGPSAAWNTGIAASRGEFVAFLGSDDLWLPAFAESCVSLLERSGPAIPCCIANALMRPAGGRDTLSFRTAWMQPASPAGIWQNVTETLATRFVAFGQTTMIRREALGRLHGFDEELRYLEDYDLALRLSLLGNWCFLTEPLVIWRQSGDSLSRQALEERRVLNACELRVLRRFASELGSGPDRGRLRRLTAAQIRRARRLQAAASLCGAGAAPLRLLGTGLEYAERLRAAAYRRSPWYPAMQTIPLEHGRAGRAADAAQRCPSGAAK